MAHLNFFGNKKARISGLFIWNQTELLQFDFLVLNVLASFWVELHDRHFLGHCFLVLAGRIEVTSTSCRFQLDFFASAFACHDGAPVGGLSLTAFAQVCENSINAIFVDQAQSGAGNAQAHPTVFALNPETAILQVRQEPALGFVVGVGNIVSDHGAFARYVADACHVDTPILL
jgi:hypothetical protein